MKARVKTTGEIVEVAYHGLGVYVDMNQWDKEYQFDEIVILDNEDPDYWTKLEHQYAGMAMQGIVSSYEAMREISKERDIPQYVANMAFGLAHALVEELKGKEEKK